MSIQETVKLAQSIATNAHQGQFRRNGTTPYIEHPAAVASRVDDEPHAQIVAWLHDVIEDTEVTADDLRKAGIPNNCIDAILLLTKSPGADYTDYLKKLSRSSLARRVKIADLISNLADNPTSKQIKKYAKALCLLTE